jgi:preprotein translocase subunit SecG
VLYYLVSTVYVVVCLVLMLVVLLQQGRAGDIASAFGGSSSQTAFGARSGATLLSRVTTACAVLFMLGALVLSVIWQRGPGSVVGGVAAPAPKSAPATPGTKSTPAPPSTTPAASATAAPPSTAPAATETPAPVQKK